MGHGVKFPRAHDMTLSLCRSCETKTIAIIRENEEWQAG